MTQALTHHIIFSVVQETNNVDGRNLPYFYVQFSAFSPHSNCQNVKHNAASASRPLLCGLKLSLLGIYFPGKELFALNFLLVYKVFIYCYFPGKELFALNLLLVYKIFTYILIFVLRTTFFIQYYFSFFKNLQK